VHSNHLNVPRPRQTTESEPINDHIDTHRVWQVLLISENEKIGIKKWVGAEQSFEFFSSLRHAVTVI
jgi:hypothetical protein